MKVDKITEVYTFSDVFDSGTFEGELLYNKARDYNRYDLCLFIAEARRNNALPEYADALSEFAENIRLYEETGEQQYKDKATGRYYHLILWNEIIRRLRNGWDESLDATVIKEIIIDELGLPEPYQQSCFACTTKCGLCNISYLAGPCSSNASAYAHFVDALGCSDKNIGEAIEAAERIRDAWTWTR